MKYELALKLKEAGFPQVWTKPDFMDIKDAIKITDIYNRYPNEIDPYRPTLSELIEACGKSFYELRRLDGDNTNCAPIDGYVWEASSPDVTPMLYVASTPEKAVAYLWLALNKK